MDIPLNKEQLTPMKLHHFLEERYKDFKKSWPSVPLKISEISSKFSEFFKKNLPGTKLYFMTELSFQKEHSDEEIESIFVSNIYDRAFQENLCNIFENLLKSMKDFADLIVFDKEIDFQLLFEFLVEMKAPEIFSLKSLNAKKANLFKNNEQLKFLKKILEMEKKNQKDKTFVALIELMSDTMSQFYIFLLRYFEKVLSVFEYQSEFKTKYLQIQTKISKFVIKQFKNKEGLVYRLFNENVSKIFENTILILNEQLKDITINDPKICIMALKEYRDQAIKLLKGGCKEEFNFIQSDLLLYGRIMEIKEKIHQKFYEKSNEFEKNQNKLIHGFEKKILSIIIDYFEGSMVPFSKLKESERKLLFTLIICSLLSQKNLEQKEFCEIMKYIHHMKTLLSIQNSDKDLDNLFLNFQTFETYKENFPSIINSKEAAILHWSVSISEELNLHTILSLILDIEKIKPFHKEGDLRMKIHVKPFKTHSHHHLKVILRNLQNYAFGYSNWDFLSLIEHMISRFLFPFENEDLLKIRTDNKELYDYVKTKFEFENLEQNGTEEVLKDIRNVDYDNLEKKMNFLLKRIEDLQEKKNAIEAPQKFEFVKLSKIETRSRIINICISGFLSQETNKRKEWADLVDFCDRKNMELLSLKWLSSTNDALYDFFSRNYAELVGFKGIISSKLLPVFGLAKILIDNPFLHSLAEAKKTGFYLAHLLGDLQIFGNSKVNLIGFSMGTIVIYECLKELKRMGRFDIIHDVVVMGGIINRDDIKSLTLNMINGRWIHCFSKKDWALKFLFRLAKFGENAVGVKRLEGDKKIVNFDCSDFVSGHLEYRPNMEEILTRIDFLQDHNYLLEELEMNDL